ncbi:class I SAM-dependent methyltransferase [Paracoccus aurantiacus]|uniref:Class I SAM-dependent methyltransferase n=1 Tax=Paracoccus aurantiacus TaxID=2599412 RepID=A0A5C6S8A8_9RHOB|nr:methyltransferase domain-containing protein [Paracoccus aurantiacus]TXB71079.1 class I SAM-dependent methyltransferase [Paracoccus aurantiacus]
MSADPALRVYAEHAGDMAARWRAARTPAELYAPVADLVLDSPCRVADIGAGPGREAQWLAGLGHDVTAVEPVQPFREIGAHGAAQVTWLDDRLPDLALTRQLPLFDLVLLTGVWQHVDPASRGQAMASLAAILRDGGRLMISLRQGPVDPHRGLHTADAGEALGLAAAAGLTMIARRDGASAQPQGIVAGVSWIWLVLGR